uniref:Uncharacterized protein n=1 Tax=Anguilla anguilla TaxID=7936 RepID=A0A0E9RMX2_ANGAN
MVPRLTPNNYSTLLFKKKNFVFKIPTFSYPLFIDFIGRSIG